MNKRPLAVTVIGWVYIVTGVFGLAFHASDFTVRQWLAYDTLLVGLVRLLAIVSGVYLLRRHNWARWLALVWMGYHVILSAFHSAMQAAIHGVFCAVLAYFLLRPEANRYFAAAKTPAE